MIKNTVFVIGAGASKEAELPTGNELTSRISELLDIRFDDTWGERIESGDYAIVEALRLHVQQLGGGKGNMQPYIKAARHISDAMPQAISIDNFIETQQDNDNIDEIALCGKLAIVRSILDAEKRSLLYFKRKRIDSNINFGSLEKTWYIPFFQMLTENCGKSGLKDSFESITLIIFNYDIL